MNKVIALDIGRVCVRLRFDLCKQALGFSVEQDPPQYFLESSQKFEHGMCSVDEWLRVFRRLTNNRFSDQELLDAWNLIIGEEIEGMSDFIREVVDLGYRFVFFSDTNEPHILYCLRNLSFAHLVTGHIFSFEVGAQKPNDQMYEAFEQKYGKPCFYLDDKACNIEGAERHGWTSHLFTDTATLRDDFFSLYS